MPQLSPDGRRLVVDTVNGEEDLFLYDLETHVEEQLTLDPANDRWPIWSPDGAQIVFTSTRDGQQNLYVKAADGSGTAAPLSSSRIGGAAANDWIDDGKTLVFGQGTPGTSK